MTEKLSYHKPYPLSEVEIESIQEEIGTCLRNGQLTNGENCRKLEDEIKRMYDVDYAIVTNNCTMGLLACNQQYKLYNVLMPAFTWWSPYLIAPQKTSQIKFVDINYDTWLMEPVKYNYNLDLLAPCGTFGSVIDQEFDHDVIFDYAHCLGTGIKRFGKATVFSLAPTKLVTSCEGGIIVTNNRELAVFAEYFRTKCCRMSEPQAIIGLATLKHLDEILSWKLKCRMRYEEKIPGKFQEIPFATNNNTIGFLNEFSLEMPDWFDYRQYYEPISNQSHLINTEKVFSKMVCLPSFYNAPIERIAESILELNDKHITREGL